jgi:hypothetical protein
LKGLDEKGVEQTQTISNKLKPFQTNAYLPEK